MLYQDYQKLNCSLHDNQFLSGIMNGVFGYVYQIQEVEPFFSDPTYNKLIGEFDMEKPTYFTLENFCDGTFILQRITFMEANNSYLRTGSKILDNGVDFLKEKTLNGFDFSSWVADGIKENDTDVQKILKTSSKESMRERLVAKKEPTYDDIFKYKKRLDVNQLTDSSLETGFYSLLDQFDNLKKLIYYNDTIKSRRTAIYDRWAKKDYYDFPNENQLEGVLENYNTKNYVFQALYISHPVVINLNRVFVKSENRWTSWRFNQNVDDIFWHLNSIPTNKYSLYPYHAKKLYISRERIRSNVYGKYMENDVTREAKNIQSNKETSYSARFSSLYNLSYENVADYTYGYSGMHDVRTGENGLTADYKGILYTNLRTYPWGHQLDYDVPEYSTYYPRRSESDLNFDSVYERIRGRSYLGYVIHENNDMHGLQSNEEYFRYINGVAMYWSSDILYSDILVNKIVQKDKTI